MGRAEHITGLKQRDAMQRLEIALFPFVAYLLPSLEKSRLNLELCRLSVWGQDSARAKRRQRRSSERRCFAHALWFCTYRRIFQPHQCMNELRAAQRRSLLTATFEWFANSETGFVIEVETKSSDVITFCSVPGRCTHYEVLPSAFISQRCCRTSSRPTCEAKMLKLAAVHKFVHKLL
jgi:hypothetical protein